MVVFLKWFPQTQLWDTVIKSFRNNLGYTQKNWASQHGSVSECSAAVSVS